MYACLTVVHPKLNAITDTLVSLGMKSPDYHHITIMYDEHDIRFPIKETKYKVPVTPIKFDVLGNSLVLLVDCLAARDLWSKTQERGCSWSFPDYTPHISVAIIPEGQTVSDELLSSLTKYLPDTLYTKSFKIEELT